MLKCLLVSMLLLSGCAPAAPPNTGVATGVWTTTYSNDGQMTDVKKVALIDGVNCYHWGGQFSCVKR
jgi:hypothetical protein